MQKQGVFPGAIPAIPQNGFSIFWSQSLGIGLDYNQFEGIRSQKFIYGAVAIFPAVTTVRG